MAAAERSPGDARLIGAAAGLFYLCFHSAYYNFDGVACAVAVELGDLAHLAHGNHLAYGLVGLAFDRLWRAAGYGGPAILVLQTLDSLLGGLGVGLFCSLLRRLGLPRGVALAGAAGLAVSQAYWFWSLEAQVYLLGVVFVLLAAREALCGKPRPVRLGAWQACAVLGHVGHVMFAPVAVYALWKAGGRKDRYARYAAALGATVLAAYAAAAIFCVKPSSVEEWRLWLLGSAALTVERHFHWYGSYSPRAVFDWLYTTLRLTVDRPGPAGLGFVLAAAPLAAAAWALRAAAGEARRLATACAVWIASYALLFISWQPFLDVYRISDLAPIWLLACLGLERLPRRISVALLAAWAAAAGLFNGFESVAPRADPAANAPYQEALWLAAVTPQDAWIVVTARGQVYVPYFAHRRPLNMRYLEDPTRLFLRLDRLAKDGQPVFISEATLEQGGWKAAFEGYGLTLEREAEGRRLYRVRRRAQGSARAAPRALSL